MKTIYVTKSNSMFDVDFDNQYVSWRDDDRSAINRVCLVDEDCIVKDENETVEAKKGDIVISFYESLFPHHFVVISSKEWRENIETYKAMLNKNKDIDPRLEKACDESC